jgi:flagellar biosynthesis chaperone FliJ
LQNFYALQNFAYCRNVELNQTITTGSNGSSSVDVSALQNQINDLDEIVSSQQVSLAGISFYKSD